MLGMDVTSRGIANWVTFPMTVFLTAHSCSDFMNCCWMAGTLTFMNLFYLGAVLYHIPRYDDLEFIRAVSLFSFLAESEWSCFLVLILTLTA